MSGAVGALSADDRDNLPAVPAVCPSINPVADCREMFAIHLGRRICTEVQVNLAAESAGAQTRPKFSTAKYFSLLGRALHQH